MKPSFLLLFFYLICMTHIQAQSIQINGAVSDSMATPLEYATVLLMQSSDSSLTAFGRTNEQGQFELKNVSAGTYLFRITYVGMQTHQQLLHLDGSERVKALGSIVLYPSSALLGDLTVAGERNPLTIRHDTIEYNAGSFKTQPNAPVEDLLKKLPGVEVQQDGSVKAQGETVQNVLVDGKQFFGKDTKLATKNLPADAVDKVQVYDKKSDVATFTGIEDGQKEKTINLELKEEKKNGYFGNAYAGGGTDDRFEGKAMINRFSKKQQLSFIGMGNNTNQQGFSVDDYLNFTGQMQKMMGGGSVRLEFNTEDMPIPLDMGGQNNGYLTTWAGGLNFNDVWKEKTEVNGSYFFSNLHQRINRDVLRETLLSDGGHFLADQQTIQNSDNTSHRINTTIDQKIDSLRSLKFTSDFSYNNTRIQSDGNTQTFDTNNEKQNENTRQNESQGQNSRWNAGLLYRQKFQKKGRTLTANLTFTLNDNNTNGKLSADNTFFVDGLAETDTIQQMNDQQNKRLDYGVALTYTEPLGKRKYLEANYAYQRNNNGLKRNVYDVDNGERQFNTQLSNEYSSIYDYHRAGMNFRLNRKKYNFSTGLAWQQTNLYGDLRSRDTSIRRSFGNLLPNLRFNYDFQSSRNLALDYEANVREPSVNELQPVIDNSDPLNIYSGNPNLKPEYSHRTDLRFATFDPATFVSFFASVDFTYTKDKIANAEQVDSMFVRTIQPVNVKNEYDGGAYASFGFQIKKISSRVSLRSGFHYVRSLNPINGVENQTKRYISTGELNYEYNLKEWLELSLGAELKYNQTHYSISTDFNQDFLTQNYTADLNVHLPWGLNTGTSLQYHRYPQDNKAYLDVPIWNAYLSKFILKNNRGELKLSVSDLLNRNVGFSRRAELNYVQEERIRSLGRYFLLTFRYSLNGSTQEGGVRVKFIQKD